MEEKFWLESWNQRKIGFHQRSVNAQLQRFWPELGLAAGDAVLVPLCGKSGDMRWIRSQGHPVLGVELSPLAVEAFFSESGVVPERRRQGGFEAYETGGIRLLCGNVFDLTAEDVVGVKAVYDRAALVALPPAMRESYAAHLADVLPSGTRMLLLTFDYPQAQMEGPPFSVPASEVERLYGRRGDVRLLASESRTDEGLAARGVKELREDAFIVSL
ncbi:MAG TPA: thiopurine S-methyltransferase [Longimicrobiaceae bacterium]|nr:thiopurine S-methyltransferase [Longimicrobiaceae bacterium]